MMIQTITETTTEHELYRIVNALRDAMTLESSAAISVLSNTITSSGESALKTTTLVKIKAARRKLIPLHIERTIEPLFNILLSPCDVYWCARCHLLTTRLPYRYTTTLHGSWTQRFVRICRYVPP